MNIRYSRTAFAHRLGVVLKDGGAHAQILRRIQIERYCNICGHQNQNNIISMHFYRKMLRLNPIIK